MQINHILVPTDFSEVSRAAFDYAAYQSRMTGSRVTIINVFEHFHLPPELIGAIWSAENLRAMESEYVSAARKRLEEIADSHFHQQSVECVSLMSSRTPAVEICDYAAKHDCDLITMSGHGRGAAGALFIGSCVQKVLAKAPCPVLVVPAAG